MLNPKSNFNFSSKIFIAEGIKIFNFHPIHIALNSCSMENYNSMKSELKTTDHKDLMLKRYRNNTKEGTENFFKGLIKFMRNSESYTGYKISELVVKWFGSKKF